MTGLFLSGMSGEHGRRNFIKKGEPVLLKRMEMKLLLYLIRNRNRLVGKEELLRKCGRRLMWGTGH